MAAASKTYTMEEVGKHKTEQDCWIVIDGKVMEIQDFLSLHPGGEDILLDGAGRDVTDDFEDTGHSSDARKQMEQYVIGVVEGYNKEERKKRSGGNGGAAATAVLGAVGPTPAALVALLVVVLAAIFLLLQK